VDRPQRNDYNLNMDAKLILVLAEEGEGQEGAAPSGGRESAGGNGSGQHILKKSPCIDCESHVPGQRCERAESCLLLYRFRRIADSCRSGYRYFDFRSLL
jgi:hypothetical protein